MKPEACRGCELLDAPGPVGYDGVEVPEVLFLGEALGYQEVKERRPFVGPAGRILRSAIAQMNVGYYGITNVWRCKPRNNKLPPGEPGAYCLDELRRDLSRPSVKVVVPLGATALDAVTEYSMSITQAQGRWFTTNWNGTRLLVLPMYHPSYLLHARGHWRDWEIGWEKLDMYLREGKTHYIPLSSRKVEVVETAGEALAFLKKLRDYTVLSVDIETNSYFMPWEGGYMLSIAFAWSDTEAFAMPWRFAKDPSVRQALKDLLESEAITFLWYNGQFDVQFLWSEGINARIDGDAMAGAHLLDERINTHSLKRDAGIWLDAPDWEVDLKQYVPKSDDPFTLIPEPKLLEYNGQDVCHTYQLDHVLRDGFDDGLRYVYENIHVPALTMLAKARYEGVRVDMFKIKELRDTFVPVLEKLTQTAREISGNAFFNPNSWQDKLKALHDRRIMVKNTRRETLEAFEGDELVDALTAYSQAHKMYSTYVEGIVDDVSDDLRVHPDFRTDFTETGRLRCSDPNMLGIPRKAEEEEHKWKRLIKQIFVCDPNTLLFHMDQKQSEVRCACYLSNDDTLKEILMKGGDLHNAMARQMYGENFTREQRVWAKMVTFGLIYNREAPSLARQLKCTVSQAQTIINKFFEQMPELLKWKKEIMKEALHEGFLTSFFGRKRRFGLITPEYRKHAENEAVNFPVSSLSTDLNLLNCIRATNEYGKYGVVVYVPIHDAALGRVPKDSLSILDDLKGLFETLPQEILKTDIPFEVDVTVGEKWSDL